MMDYQYDSSFDIGVAVAEDKKQPQPSTIDAAAELDDAATILNSGTSKRSKKRKKKEKSDGAVRLELSSRSSVDASPPLPPLKGMFIEERKKLPVYQHRADLCKLVSKHDVVLVVAETVSLYRIHHCISQSTCISSSFHSMYPKTNSSRAAGNQLKYLPTFTRVAY